MASTQLFSDLTCEVVKDLLKLQDFASFRSLISGVTSLSKVLVAIKSKHSDGTSASLKTAVDEFSKAVDHVKDIRVMEIYFADLQLIQ